MDGLINIMNGEARTPIEQTRAKRLALLESELGSQQAVIEMTGYAQAYLSNLKHGRRPFGEKPARRIEKACGKPYLWLDDVNLEKESPEDAAAILLRVFQTLPDDVRKKVLESLK